MAVSWRRLPKSGLSLQQPARRSTQQRRRAGARLCQGHPYRRSKPVASPEKVSFVMPIAGRQLCLLHPVAPRVLKQNHYIIASVPCKTTYQGHGIRNEVRTARRVDPGQQEGDTVLPPRCRQPPALSDASVRRHSRHTSPRISSWRFCRRRHRFNKPATGGTRTASNSNKNAPATIGASLNSLKLHT